MEIKRLSIKNWQNITYLNIEFEKLLILIGESNKGKTSILKSLSAILGKYEIQNSDFKNENMEIEIKIKYFEKTSGFCTFKLLKRLGEESKYFILNHGKEKELRFDEVKNKLFTINGIIITSKDVGVYNALCQIRDIFILENNESKIVKELESKIQYLKDNFLSQSLQRKVLFSFFKNILDDIEYYRNNLNGRLENLFLIFEEPELHLSPQRSREMYSLLIKLSEIGVQIVMETHSSYFVGLKQYKSICLIKKIKNDIKVYQYTGKLLNGDEIKNFNMNYWINPDRGEMFFAKKVILVEGQTDKIALSYLAKKLGIYNYNYSIVECGSKSIIPQFIKILNAYKIPYVAVYDKDNHKWRNETEIENSNMKNKKIKGLINKYIGDYIEFENDIEEEVYQEERERKNYKNKPYYTLQKISEDEYKIPLKLEEKIKRIYK
ncbi:MULTISPECIES: ATP-dependent nuclease [Cetobacterium]|uniref:ATP-dependent nuclease n=2 Tax=Fusobacteriaceae TaxID=203492 RepID=UPI001F050F81|nr:TOPRIM nucleotidyl transferase/hydrolase domain-containing protein [Cetobacterium somerae]MCX3067915.1 AAA family ATPase [Cetobacterium somerae]UPO97792.1 AAA family ATPase [Cetobacterium somerae]